MIVLDACRVDALREVAPKYDWLPTRDEIGSIYSLGSFSGEWMEVNFHKGNIDEMKSTAHVTGNLWTHKKLNSNDWQHLDEVWNDGWDDSEGIVLPDVLTDRAIEVGRNIDANRYIVHYMKPHEPYPSLDLSKPYDQSALTSERDRESVWKHIISGEIDKPTVWRHYIRTLHLALDEVERLIHNFDAENPVVTADHAELFGKYGFYGHPRNVHIPELVRVPWVEVDASDRETSSGSTPAESNISNETVEERLESLGYK